MGRWQMSGDESATRGLPWVCSCVFRLGAAREFASLGVDSHFLALFDKQRNLDLQTSLEHRRFGHAAAGGIAAHAHLGACHGQLDMRRKQDADRVAVVAMDLRFDVIDEQATILTERVGAECQRFESLLIHEVIAVGVGVGERHRRHHEIGLGEFFARLEGLVEYRASNQVPHLQPHQRLSAAGRGLRDLDVKAMVWRILVLEVRLALDLNGFYQRGHSPIVSWVPVVPKGSKGIVRLGSENPESNRTMPLELLEPWTPWNNDVMNRIRIRYCVS